jgi:putative acyl-CoA dehydrogenase
MERDASLTHYRTHEVTNQAPPLLDYDLFATDAALAEAVRREGGGWAKEQLSALGSRLGSAEVIEWGFLANKNLPVLQTHDRFGARRDVVEYHPAYHQLLGLSIAHGIHTSPWAEPKPGAHVARGAAFFMLAQVEAGVCCPTTVGYAAVPTLRAQPDVAAEWTPRLLSRRYDPRFLPASAKTGAIISMGMTEKQGGSDLRQNSTRAFPAGPGGPGAEYRLVGHKWFFSIPMSDAFLVTAQAPAGLSCFLLPRFLPDGTVNGLHLQRLKDKLGNRANASSEVELHDAYARLVGEEGRGVATVIEMANYSRIDCALGSAGQIRQALAQALHHASHRGAFGRRLVDQPLMTRVLADLAIESEAATALALRLARAFDRQESDPAEATLRRILTPAVKYFVCKRAAIAAAEALEVFGGGGYVEESIMPRLYREAPLNSVWEGSGNVMCLDVARALGRSKGGLDALSQELALARGADARLDRFVASLEADLRAGEADEATFSRRHVERIVLALAGSLLRRHAPSFVADAFSASRLGGEWSGTFGTLPGGLDLKAIVARAGARPS